MNTQIHETLYFKDGASDKIYQAQINQDGDGYTVTFAYGRRGSTLKAGAKTEAPVALGSAQAIFDKLINEKLGKGYTRGADGAPYVGTSSREDSGIRCQLLNAVDGGEAGRLCLDARYVAQEKFDGERRLLESRDGVVRGINRKGQYVAVTESIARAGALLGDRYVIDGEVIGDVLHVFDIIEDHQGMLLECPYDERLQRLCAMWLHAGVQDSIHLVATAFTTPDKDALLARVKADHGEGLVFKRRDACYSAGRPASGGASLKYKLYESCSVVVAAINAGRRSVAVSAFVAGGHFVALGNVTVPPNWPVPTTNEVVEIRYLYAFERGALYQPVYLGPRNDITPGECTVAQLKYKPVSP